MTGSIQYTDRCGGMIRPDTGEPAVRFRWVDCDGIAPADVGHGCAVKYYLEIVGGREKAIDVRRSCA